MNENPYKASKWPAEFVTHPISLYPLALAGLALGIVAGAAVAAGLMDNSQPIIRPIRQEDWPVFTLYCGIFGFWGLFFGGLADSIRMELRRIRGPSGCDEP